MMASPVAPLSIIVVIIARGTFTSAFSISSDIWCGLAGYGLSGHPYEHGLQHQRLEVQQISITKASDSPIGELSLTDKSSHISNKSYAIRQSLRRPSTLVQRSSKNARYRAMWGQINQRYKNSNEAQDMKDEDDAFNDR